MADCPHGFPQAQCLICSTLSRSQANAQVAEKVAYPTVTTAGQAPVPYASTFGEGRGRSGNGANKTPAGPRRQRRKGRHNLLMALLVIVVGLLAWGLVQGVLGLALHIAEYVAVAVLSGWAGYRAGHWHARHEHR